MQERISADRVGKNFKFIKEVNNISMSKNIFNDLNVIHINSNDHYYYSILLTKIIEKYRKARLRHINITDNEKNI